jgi:RNA polymerase sigma-70 factor (ECF subfamily)
MDKKLLEYLMRELQGGKIDALDGIYELASRSVYLLSYSILRSGEKAEDIMQETFLRLAANIGKYRLGTNAAAWICTIARNLSYREYGKASGVASLDAFGGDIADDKNYEDLWTDNVALKKAMNGLSVREREIVTLFAVGGYKHREIAEIVGKPPGTVRWAYNAAIKKLRKFMEREYDE